MAVYALGARTSKVKAVQVGNRFTENLRDIAQYSTHFYQFWELMDTIKVHGYIRASMGVIGRSTVGAWWSLRKHGEFGSSATERQRKRLMRFYLNPDKPWTNIKDFQNIAYKVMIGAMYLRYFGQAAYQILRNSAGEAIGFDHLPGYVCPNVDIQGNFLSPAFYQYPTRNPRDRVAFASPSDTIFIINPDFEGFPGGGSDSASLTNFALPVDIYLQTAAREYLKNRDLPEAFYLLSPEVSDEAFDEFVKSLEAKYAGPNNIGRNPIAVKGDLEIKTLSKMPSDLPYQQARDDVREELLAVTGTPGAKLGLSTSLASANLRETRREFHETTMIPLFRLIEVALYEQLHVREFVIQGWELKFNSPDFLNAVERATVHMRYKQMGALNANEVRYEIGQPARKDDNGDKYDDEMKTRSAAVTPNPQGSPPDGRPIAPDAPAQTGEPTLDNQDPVRGDQHDQTTRMLMLHELRQWRTFALRRFSKGGTVRPFQTNYIPELVQGAIERDLAEMGSAEQVRQYFMDAEQLFLEA